MAMSMLPMLASALSGLGAGGNNGSGGSTGTGSGGGDTGTGGDGELSPQAQKAIKALQTLADAYGDKNSKDPEVQKVRKQLGITGNNNTTGSGSTATAVKAKQLYQRNAAAAFNNLDNDLYNYIKTHAGKHKIDKTAVRQLLRDVDAALNELGPTAFTKTGQQKVHQILALALKKAQAIVSGGNTNSTETATEIKRLTNQYLYNIYGKKYPKAAGGSAKAQKAIETALGKLGKPYVWGAEGPNSFDCSGLMQYAAKSAGVSIPRVADDQYNQLPKVAPSAIRPGDLIFPDAQYKNGVFGHVMMYIGNNQVVEAPKPGSNVRVQKLPSSFHAARWS